MPFVQIWLNPVPQLKMAGGPAFRCEGWGCSDVTAKMRDAVITWLHALGPQAVPTNPTSPLQSRLAVITALLCSVQNRHATRLSARWKECASGMASTWLAMW